LTALSYAHGACEEPLLGVTAIEELGLAEAAAIKTA
jgi:hypothetical protein